MTLEDVRREGDGDRPPAGRVLVLVWVAVYAAGLVSSLVHGAPLWAWILGGVGAAAWAARVLIPARMRAAALALALLMIAVGGVAGPRVDLLSAVPLAVGLVQLSRTPAVSVRWVGVAIALGIAATGVGALLVMPWTATRGWLVLVQVVVILLAVLVGISRRQRLSVAQQSHELEAERARAVRLDERAGLARDLHDVLAHGLGGLVVQLDAVDALLDAGRIAEAEERVRSARALARDALTDARRAVDALRADPDAVPAPEFRQGLEELLAAGRGLGSRIEARLDPGPTPIPGPVAAAVRRALQEALTNARKHAPDEPVSVVVDRDGGVLSLRVSNPVGAPGELAATGGGRGLEGMRERFAAVPGGGVTARESDGAFVVDARATVP